MANAPKLLDRCREAIWTRHYSRRTEEAYVGWIRRYILYHRKTHPAAMGADEVNAFVTYLAVEGKVSASTQGQALSVLVFLYRHVLDDPLPWLDEIVRAARPRRLPVVLSRDEVGKVLSHLQGTERLVASILYGAGLRLLEALRLRVKDVDFAANLLTVREGKGAKDRRAIASAESADGIKRAGCSRAAGARAGPRRRGGRGVAAGRDQSQERRRWTRASVAVHVPVAACFN
jgi:site-specific recombinase XerD